MSLVKAPRLRTESYTQTMAEKFLQAAARLPKTHPLPAVGRYEPKGNERFKICAKVNQLLQWVCKKKALLTIGLMTIPSTYEPKSLLQK